MKCDWIDDQVSGMFLSIEAAKVSPLVMRLYGIQIFEIEQQQAFALRSGLNVINMAQSNSQRRNSVSWIRLLGAWLLRGCDTDEGIWTKWREVSKCVSMKVPRATDRPAKITITINDFTMNYITTEFWISQDQLRSLPLLSESLLRSDKPTNHTVFPIAQLFVGVHSFTEGLWNKAVRNHNSFVEILGPTLVAESHTLWQTFTLRSRVYTVSIG